MLRPISEIPPRATMRSPPLGRAGGSGRRLVRSAPCMACSAPRRRSPPRPRRLLFPLRPPDLDLFPPRPELFWPPRLSPPCLSPLCAPSDRPRPRERRFRERPPPLPPLISPLLSLT